MLNTVERHIACLEQIYFALLDYEIPWPRFRDAYVEATRTHIRNSQDTHPEHRFEDRFVHAFQLAGVTQKLQASDLAHLVVPFGKNVVREAQVIDGATEVVPELAKHVRLGVVSNTPTSRS
jgi:hypothetical protein